MKIPSSVTSKALKALGEKTDKKSLVQAFELGVAYALTGKIPAHKVPVLLKKPFNQVKEK